MRTPLVVLFGSLLVSCTVGDPGTGGDDDTGGGGAVCGDGVKASTEACDDGNTAGGDGCSATCTVEAVPKLDMLIDKPTLATELRTANMATVTLVGSGGFSGQVSLAASVVNAQGAPVPGWTVALNNPNVTVPADGSVDVVATLTIPSENKIPGSSALPKFDATLKIDATSSLGTKSVTSAVSALNQLSLNVTMSGGQCVYSQVMGLTRVAVGTKVRMVNKGTANMIFHSDGNTTIGLPHQSTAGTGTPVDGSYDNTILAAGANFGWYCHSPGPNPNNNGIAVGITTVAAP